MSQEPRAEQADAPQEGITSRGRFALMVLAAALVWSGVVGASILTLRAGSRDVARRHDRYVGGGEASRFVERVLAPRPPGREAEVQLQQSDPRQMEWIGPYRAIADAEADLTSLQQSRLVDTGVLCLLDEPPGELRTSCASGQPRVRLCMMPASRHAADLGLTPCPSSRGRGDVRALMVLLGSQARLLQTEREASCRAQLCRALIR